MIHLQIEMYSYIYFFSEGNQCADYMIKLRAASDIELLLHDFSPMVLKIF